MMGTLHSTKQTVFTPLCLLTGFTITCSLPLNPPAMAQIIPDNSLGNESSVVVPNQNINGLDSDRIEGGAIRGSNLFHSFQEFNVDNGRGAYFSNPENISNILSRVTGNNLSNILGTLGVLGNANVSAPLNVNLFLINPNGIVFGPNARLDVGGSFFASTADGILFENGVEFAASNPDAPPLLTINIPIGLNFRENPGSIVSQTLSTQVDSEGNLPPATALGLYVAPEKTIALIGGEVRLDNGLIASPGSRIELGGLSEPGIVQLNSDGSLSFPTNTQRADVLLTNGSIAGVVSNPGGSIDINARNLEISNGSRVVSGVLNDSSLLNIEDGENLETESLQAGDITINATESIRLTGQNSAIRNRVSSNATGNAGNIDIQTNLLSIDDKASISTSTFSNGNGGNLTITATDIALIGVDSNLVAEVQPGAIGNGGTLTINTQNLLVRDGAQISTSTFGDGDAGDLFINTQNLQVRDASLVTADTFAQGDAGQLIIKATNLVEVRDAFSFITTNVESEGIGNGGTLIIDTQRLSVRDGAQIGAATGGRGNGGDVTITANDIEITGTAAGGASSIGVSVELGATGNGGTLTINTQHLLVQDGAQISVGTFGNGDGGDLIITTTDMEVIGDSVVGTSVQLGAVGNGGNMTINTQRLVVKDGAQVLASTFGNGDGGNLNIIANMIELIGASSGLFTTVEPGAVGNAGTLTINTQNLRVQDNAQISAATNGQGGGANLTINATDVELIGNAAESQHPSGLFTSVDNGATGNGGTLTLNTQRLTVRDGAQITTTTFVNGDAGDLIVNATDIELVGTSANGQTASGLFADVEPESTGKGGELRVNANNLTIRDGARIDVRSEGTEAAGDLIINASNILLDNQASLNGETTAGEGDIILNTSDLRLRNNSNITTNATGEATGGNITINTETLTALENSDISANAEDAFGGRIIVNADGILGAVFRDQQSRFSDITATSELGPEFSGTVELNTELDPSSGLIDLSQTIVDPNDLIAQEFCRQRGASQFVVTGKGGIAADPNDKATGNQINVDLVEPVPFQPRNSSRQRSQTDDNQPISSLAPRLRYDLRHATRTGLTLSEVETLDIVPARGWIRDENGDVILVSYDPTQTGVQRQQHNPHFCQP